MSASGDNSADSDDGDGGPGRREVAHRQYLVHQQDLGLEMSGHSKSQAHFHS